MLQRVAMVAAVWVSGCLALAQNAPLAAAVPQFEPVSVGAPVQVPGTPLVLRGTHVFVIQPLP